MQRSLVGSEMCIETGTVHVTGGTSEIIELGCTPDQFPFHSFE
jgi:hypothetical protein